MRLSAVLKYLLFYEGMCNPNEYSQQSYSRRFQFTRLAKVGKREVHRVLRIDEEQGKL